MSKSRDVSLIHDAESENVIEPILAGAVPVLRGGCERIFLSREKTIEFEVHFQHVARVEASERPLFDASVGSVNIDAQAVPH